MDVQPSRTMLVDLVQLRTFVVVAEEQHLTRAAERLSARGLQLNTIVRYDNASLARPILDAGVGMMLLREDLALQAERDGSLALTDGRTGSRPPPGPGPGRSSRRVRPVHPARR